MTLPPILDRALRGITPALLGICGAYLVFGSVFSWTIAVPLGRGWPLAQVAEAYVRVLAAETLQFLPFFAGVAAFNLVPGRALVRGASALAVVAVGTAVAMYATWPLVEPILAGWFDRRDALVGTWLMHFAIPALFTLVVMLIAAEREAQGALEQQRLQIVDLDRGLAEARLRMSQAQIEPHFLFNTLANIRRLYSVEPQAGRAMLRHFASMLASTLPAMRDARSTLAQEVANATAYLGVQQIRMGRRLRYGIDVPAALLPLEFPPMMLVTLVENAIKHGIGPLPAGGTLNVSARKVDGMLRVCVTDSGRGLASASGTGIGLANIEARLRAARDGAGRLLLEENAGGGVTATIDIAVAP